jgi:hypothetical protein
MNTNIMAVISLLVIAALVGVLLYFVQRLTQVLEHTGTILRSGKVIAGNIRNDCQNIISGVVALNKNLGVAAGGLGTVAETANRAAARAASAKVAQEAAARQAAAQQAAAQARAAQQAAAPAAASAWTPPDPVSPAAAAPVPEPAPPAPEPATGFVWPYPPPARA